MIGLVHVLPLWSKVRYGKVFSTVSKHDKELSPFHLGPCKLYGKYISRNMENAWQFSKVYHKFANNGEPTQDYFKWAENGWFDEKAHRYPMGKGAIPLYSYWDGEKIGYIDARKTIYAPLYAEQVVKTEKFKMLQNLVNTGTEITLLDYDAYDHIKRNMTLTDVLNNPKSKMGHAFVLAMLLTKDNALKQIKLRSNL